MNVRDYRIILFFILKINVKKDIVFFIIEVNNSIIRQIIPILYDKILLIWRSNYMKLNIPEYVIKKEYINTNIVFQLGFKQQIVDVDLKECEDGFVISNV